MARVQMSFKLKATEQNAYQSFCTFTYYSTNSFIDGLSIHHSRKLIKLEVEKSYEVKYRKSKNVTKFKLFLSHCTEFDE